MKTVVLEVQTLEESLKAAARAMKSRRGERTAHIAFETPELLWQVLTVKRWEILKALCGLGPVSIREAARRVRRDVKAVHSDITALTDAGILERSKSGVEFPYDSIKVEFTLSAQRDAA